MGEVTYIPLSVVPSAFSNVKTSREITIKCHTEVKAKGYGEFLIPFSIDRWLYIPSLSL
jgi:hypothetical protein